MRQSILDHLVDTEGKQSVAQILAAMPAGTTRNTLESAIRRAFTAGEIERVGPGVYKLAPARSAEAPTQPAPPAVPEPQPEEKAERDRQEVLARDAARKRESRRRDAESALARQAAADARLRDRLTQAAGDNVQPGPLLDDLSAVRTALGLGVPMDTIEFAVMAEHSLTACPTNLPATSWWSPGLLKRMTIHNPSGFNDVYI